MKKYHINFGRIISIILILLLSRGPDALALDANALPTGGKITAGSGGISQSGNKMAVTQTTGRMIADWSTFNIGSNAAVAFAQPGSSSVALNRIYDQNPSLIYGNLTANGQVFLVNNAGIYFGPTAQVNVGGLVASSLNITKENFLAGNYLFEKSGAAGAIVNQGSIRTSSGGYIAFISPAISNDGSLTAPGGTVAMAAGDRVSLDFTGDSLVNFTVEKGAVDALIENKGLISADGGAVILSAKAADSVTTAVVNNSGVIEARTMENRSGRILLLSDMESGEVIAGGTLDASAPKGGNGGFIETSAAKVTVKEGLSVNTSAPYGKTGLWLIDPNDFTIAASGGDMTGTQATAALASSNLTIASADGGTSGSGDIFVNDTVSWSANKLTLNAYRNIGINSTLYGSGTAGLALYYGQGASDGVISGTTATYSINAPVNLASTGSFATKQGSGGALKNYTIITSLGAAGSTTGTDLQGMKGNLSRYYVLGSDIDASATASWNGNAGFDPVGNSSTNFTGLFDGLVHTITGLTINRSSTDYVGLFGYTSRADILNVGLVGGSVTGRNNVGGLAGRAAYPSITNSFNTGSVTGSDNVGGLVGRSSGGITNSYSTGSVSGSNYVGGLVGYFTGNIVYSYSTGSVTGTGSYVGGLLGANSGGAVSSYWNTETSGQTTSYGGTGLTTAQMKQSANFSGWDFTGVWRIYDGYSYPLLKAFLTPLTITANNAASRTYDATAYSGGNGVTYSATPSALLLGSLTYGGTAQSAKNAGTYTITPAGFYSTTQQGYDITYANGALTINPATLTITGSSAANKVYDSTTAATVTAGTLSGLIGTDTLNVSGNGIFDTKNAGTGKTVAATYVLANGSGLAGNYTLASENLTANITTKNLTAAYTGTNKTYDGATAATVTGSSADIIGGDTVTFSQSAAFADKNAGTGITINVSAISLGGADATNYSLTANTATTSADITAKTIAITGSSVVNKVYDGNTTATATAGTLSGLIGSETLNVSGSGTFDTKNVGTGKTVAATYALANGSGLAANYTLAGETLTADITPASLTVTANNDSRTYNATAYSGGNGVAYAGFVGGENSAVLSGTLAYTGTSQGAENAGSYVIQPGGLASGNYGITYANGGLTINPAALTITGSSAANKVYDGTTTATVAAGTLSGLVGTETLSVSGSGTFDSKNAGSRTATATYTLADGSNGGLSGNYTLADTTGLTADITKAALTVTANNDLVTYSVVPYSGGNGVSYTGLRGSDTAGVLGGSLLYGGSSQGAVNGGLYSINPYGLTSGNYNISFEPGDLAIGSNTGVYTGLVESSWASGSDPTGIFARFRSSGAGSTTIEGLTNTPLVMSR